MEDVATAAVVWFEAAGVRDWEVTSDGSGAVVVVADEVVVASAAMQVALHGVPFGGDVDVDAVPVQVVINQRGAGGCLSKSFSQLECRENRSDLSDKSEGHQDGVHH